MRHEKRNTFLAQYCFCRYVLTRIDERVSATKGRNAKRLCCAAHLSEVARNDNNNDKYKIINTDDVVRQTKTDMNGMQTGSKETQEYSEQTRSICLPRCIVCLQKYWKSTAAYLNR